MMLTIYGIQGACQCVNERVRAHADGCDMGEIYHRSLQQRL